MFGHLVPCGGGKTVPLAKTRLVLSHRRATSEETPSPARDIELTFIDGWWHARRLENAPPLIVNGQEREATRLKPNDVLTIGSKFYRITFSPPEEAAEVSTPARSTSPPPAPPPPPPKEHYPLGMLIPCGGGPSFVLRNPKIVIGRKPGCDVVIPEKYVSSQHCALEWVSGYWKMTDLDSTNGTTIDGMTYRQKWVLPGSVIGMMSKRLRLEYEPQGERPDLADDDTAMLPKRSLLELAGLKGQRLERVLKTTPNDEPQSQRWTIDE